MCLMVFPTRRTQTLHFSFLNADKHRHWMPSLLRWACDAGRSENHLDDEESSDYTGHVLALNGYKKYFCLFRPVFTGDDPSDLSSDTSFSSDSRRKSRSRSRSSSHSRSRSHSREDGSSSKRGTTRATSIEVHHKLDRLGLWMERLMEGTLARLQVPAWPSLDTTTESWGQSKKWCTLWCGILDKSFSKRSKEQCCCFQIIEFLFAGVGCHWSVAACLQNVTVSVEQMEMDKVNTYIHSHASHTHVQVVSVVSKSLHLAKCVTTAEKLIYSTYSEDASWHRR